MKRRAFMAAAAAGSMACGTRPRTPAAPPGTSAVSILRAASYSVDLLDTLKRGATMLGLEARGKRVLLKPNLVEFDAATAINTHVSLLAAAVELFHWLGAADVRIGEGPGHRRDTMFLAEEAGYRAGIPEFEARFVDLNRDDVASAGRFGDLPEIFLPQSALGADLVVSVAKMKTHHWAGATLSMKNLFGLVPGALYGWPKNELHRVGIALSVAELHRLFSPRGFAIVDGIVGMEGNGPIQGNPVKAGVVVMGADLVAVDATCCRIMGIDPLRMDSIKPAAARGHAAEDAIEQRGETIASVRHIFDLIDDFRALRP